MDTTEIRLDRLHLSSKTTFITRYADYLILCLVATVGLAGSLYVFANRSMDLGMTTVAKTSMLAPEFATAHMPVTSQDKFDSLVRIEGAYIAGQELKLTLIPDREDARYYIDMGNKQRAIFTSQHTYYTYPEAGEYTIELKVLKERLLTTIASKQIVIK